MPRRSHPFRGAISSIYVYKCDGPPQYRIEEITDYIAKTYPKTKVVAREDFFSLALKQENHPDIDDLARKITLCRVHKVNQETEDFSPLALEIDYEKKRLIADQQLKGVIYDGFKLQAVCRKLLAPGELNFSTCHIIFTNQLIASFDAGDRRYHLRVGIYGYPHIISTPGLIEALAKPREYYLKLQMGIDALSLNQEFKQEIISYEDSRISELLKGYCLQALFHQLKGDPFCFDKNCRLYNAHWQKEAIWAQIEAEDEFCPKHTEIISQWQK
ncbi:MAG: DUF6775 family putative metallopeptidase [Candidatus Omnitrophota bacterium]